MTTTMATAAFGDDTILITIGAVLGSAATIAYHNITCEVREWWARRRAMRQARARFEAAKGDHHVVILP